ncbi:unnamed protein product [Haemonchus placei]|uniref:LCCL domain-containing protein n=1 Tax=Haemonchus placei TaxID=6290 RepID=A0A0N4VUA1_HAEPC|nr:unnamed protein product [Haemonchus placei]
MPFEDGRLHLRFGSGPYATSFQITLSDRQAMLYLLLLFHLPLVSTNCIQCASPTLFNQWQLTGLPSHPAGLPFTPLCNSIGTDDPPEENMKVSSCSTVCFEMVIPSANQYHFVRGCHDEFIETGVTEQQVNSDDKCFYSKKGDQLITSTDGKIQVPAVSTIYGCGVKYSRLRHSSQKL